MDRVTGLSSKINLIEIGRSLRGLNTFLKAENCVSIVEDGVDVGVGVGVGDVGGVGVGSGFPPTVSVALRLLTLPSVFETTQ